MSLAKAREHLAKYGLEGKIMEFSASSASVVEAANAIGCKEREIVKTLSFMLGENPILIAHRTRSGWCVPFWRECKC